jgi:uncharacterized protein (TIGR02246 family)
MRRIIFGVVLFTALTASPARAQTIDADRRAIEAAFDKTIAAAKRGDARAYLAYFDSDAVLAEMIPGQQPVVGKKALRPWIADFLQKYTFDWSDYKSEEVVVVRDLAFHRYTGVASFIPKSGGEMMRLRRRYIDMLRRDSKGAWKIWHHVWGPDCEEK